MSMQKVISITNEETDEMSEKRKIDYIVPLLLMYRFSATTLLVRFLSRSRG